MHNCLGAVLPVDATPPRRVEWRCAGGACWASDVAAADVVRADAERLVARRADLRNAPPPGTPGRQP